MTPLLSALIAAGALGAACSLLSVFVVSKRWAFIGEGIAHAGFGGAGTAWMAAMLFPGVAWLGTDIGVYSISVLFCMLVAGTVAAVTLPRANGRRAEVDTVIGIFLVGSLAWGFLGYALYWRATGHRPPQFGDYLGFEHLSGLSSRFVALAVVLCAAVVTVIGLSWKELLFYTTDERQAGASGVNVPLVHYGLILLLALVIVVGMKLMGTVLVVALLVLPGATGMQLGKSLRGVWVASIVTGLIGALGGTLLSHRFREVSEGPAIVLVLFALFCVAFIAGRFRRVS